LDEKGRKIIAESIDIGIGFLIVVIGFLLIFFSLSWFDSFIEGMRVIEDWIFTLRLIFIVFSIIIVISGIKKIIQNIIL